MRPIATVLDFDHLYRLQPSLQGGRCEWIDLTDIRQTNSYCESRALAIVQDRLKGRKARTIALSGTGNYHYVTYLLMSDVKMPFTLVLFDHHTDMLPAPCESVISCGSWVVSSIQECPYLKHVVIIGARSDLASAIPRQYQSMVSVFEESIRSWTEPAVKRAILSSIPTCSVYVSIDKDVLDEADAITNWDQGNMRLRQLLNLLIHIALHKEICGLDICGEYPLSFSNYQRSIQAARANEKANRMILATILRKKSQGVTPGISA